MENDDKVLELPGNTWIRKEEWDFQKAQIKDRQKGYIMYYDCYSKNTDNVGVVTKVVSDYLKHTNGK